MSPWLNLFILVLLFYTVLRLLGLLFNRFMPPRQASVTGRRTGWARIPKFYRHIITNLGVGLGIFLLLLPFHRYPWLMDIEDAAMDWVMQIRQGVIPFDPKKPKLPFILLDIDNETYRDWGEPLFTPRDRLKYLIDTAIKANPSLIVIDIDVSQKVPVAEANPTDPKAPLHPDDQALREYLQHYVEDCQRQEKTAGEIVCPPIILVRAFRYTQDSVPVIRPSFLEETLTQPTPYVQWGSTLFYRSADQVVRRWWLWQAACHDRDGNLQPIVVPSIQLLAAALIKNGITQEIQKEIAEKLQPEKLQPQHKNCTELPNSHLPQTIEIGQLTVSTGPQHFRQRIGYSLPWEDWKEPDPNEDPDLKQPRGDIRYTKTDQSGRIILTVFSAKPFATPTPAPLKADDQVIIIGGSYAEGRDIYATPLGQMPGMLILTNAIHSLLEYQEIDPLPHWQKLLIEAILIVMMSVAFAYWESFWAMLFSAILVILVLLPASIFSFRYGYWLDFAIPLLTVFLHELVAEFETLQKKAREKTKMLD